MICTQSAAISEVMKKLGITESEATKLLAVQEKTMSAKRNESKVLFDSQTDFLEGNKIEADPKKYDGSPVLNQVTDYSEALTDNNVILFNSKSKAIISFNGKELPAAALSNFANLAVPIADSTGIMYGNVEAYFMAEQYSPNSHHRLALSKLSGLEAKQYSFKDDNWKGKVKLNNLDRAEIMERAMFHKFSTDLLLAEFIDVFRDFAFVEEMDPSAKARKVPEDNVWGASTKYKAKSLLGVNNTGKVMEKVRKRILSGERVDTQHYPSHTKTHYVGAIAVLAKDEVFVTAYTDTGGSYEAGGAGIVIKTNNWDSDQTWKFGFEPRNKNANVLGMFKFFEHAENNPDKKFLVGYNTFNTGIKGIDGDAMAQMFAMAEQQYAGAKKVAGRPSNVIFSESMYSAIHEKLNAGSIDPYGDLETFNVASFEAGKTYRDPNFDNIVVVPIVDPSDYLTFEKYYNGTSGTSTTEEFERERLKITHQANGYTKFQVDDSWFFLINLTPDANNRMMGKPSQKGVVFESMHTREELDQVKYIAQEEVVGEGNGWTQHTNYAQEDGVTLLIKEYKNKDLPDIKMYIGYNPLLKEFTVYSADTDMHMMGSGKNRSATIRDFNTRILGQLKRNHEDINEYIKLQIEKFKNIKATEKNLSGKSGDIVVIQDAGGKGTPAGDAKDKAMRVAADSFIGEVSGDTKSSTRTSHEEILAKSNSSQHRTSINKGSTTATIAVKEKNPSVVMLARNGKLRNQPLTAYTKTLIREFNSGQTTFVVGDMPGVDEQFIDYMNEIDANYTVYTTNSTPRVKNIKKKVESEQGSSTRTGDQLFDPSLGDTETKTEIDFQKDGSGIFDVFSEYVSEEMENGHNGANPFYSQEFMENIEQVLTGFDNVLQKTNYSKITLRDIKLAEDALFQSANSGRDTAGTLKTFADRSAELTIRYNKAFGTATKSEIFMHEMIHFMIHRAMQNNPELKKAIQNLKEQIDGTGLTYEIFLQGMQMQGRQPTSADIESAKDKYEYAFGKYSDPEEFMAYALSNQDLFHTIKNFVPEQGVLDAFKMNDSDGKAIGSFKKLLNAFINMINKIWSSNVQVGGKKAAMLLTETVNKLAEEQFNLDMSDYMEKDAFMKGDQSTLDNWDDKLKPHVEKFDAKVLDLTQAIKKKESFKKIGEKMKDVAILGRIIESNFFQSILSTITKKTDDSKWADVYALYRQGKNNMEKHRQGVSEAVERLVEGYVEGVDSGTRDAITTVIFNTDLGSLIDAKNGIGYSDLDIILDDNNDHLDSLYQNALYDIEKFYNAKGRTAFGPFSSTSEEMVADIEQAKGLAKMMATGVAYSPNQQINANNIYNKFYTSTLEYDDALGVHISSVDSNRTNTEEDSEIISKLNRFITLAALKETPASDRKLISNYLGDETNAKNMKSILNMYDEYVVKKADMLKVANAYDPIQKGYFDQLNRANMTFELIPEEDLDYHTGKIGRMKNIGYYGKIGGIKYYKVVGHEYTTDFDEGMLSIAGNPIPGKSLKSLLSEQMREEDKKLSKRDKRSSSKIDEIVEDKIIRFVNSGGTDTSIMSFEGDWNAIPVYDMRGRIIDYKLDISRQEKVQHLGSELDVVKSAAYTFSKFTHREASLVHNEKVIDKMLDYSKTNYLEDPDDFVMIEKYPENGKDADGNHVKFDENIHGRWNTIPEYTRKYIFEKTGAHRLVIPKDMVELIIGEKGATIGNFNLGPIDMRNFKRLRKLLMVVEGLSGEILKWAKETIVIRTGSVVWANLVSNMAVAWMRAGIPPHEFLIEARKKWIELNEYRDLDEKYQNVMAEYHASGSEDATLKRQISVLQTRLHNHPFHKLVADGQFSVIIEDVNVGDAPSGRIATAIEDLMNNKRVPQGVRSVKEFITMDRNTAMFKGMMKLTQYGDVITRQIMFEKMKSEAKRRGYIMTDEDEQGLLNMLDQLFVNYGYIDNRYLRYMDKHAGVWFTKYFFRQLKAMQTVVAAAPAYYGSFIAAEAIAGLDVATPDDSYYQPIDSLVNRMHFLHPSNIFETLTTPPIYNLLPNPITDTVKGGKGLILDWN